MKKEEILDVEEFEENEEEKTNLAVTPEKKPNVFVRLGRAVKGFGEKHPKLVKAAGVVALVGAGALLGAAITKRGDEEDGGDEEDVTEFEPFYENPCCEDTDEEETSSDDEDTDEEI